MKQLSREFRVRTRGPGFYDFTNDIRTWLSNAAVEEGIVTLFVRHTSASLTIQENADPDVQLDLVDALERIAPRSSGYRHGSEGPDDMPAHIKTMVTSVSLQIPVVHGGMVLGTWQGLYLIEHRDRPHNRRVAAHFLGSIPD